ncbi:hypothetical protein POV27_16890 [Aureisphaera galaxeae]|uniref:hypothetical protein n=1 Tax=Aureisphaera galaxeae TaxID=1538023 RepID=UPI00235010D1|nr:hypothetical protein [Aureisphaera galaxeae]MDC8005733.1 hypothetical protein [Aureisphaera galaxeae]
MRKLLLHVILPLTLLSFWTITKWWFGLAVDAKHVIFYGFPFIYKCEGFHTSLSTQYFIAPLLLNMAVYFLFWVVIVGIINRFYKARIPLLLVRGFWMLSMVYVSFSLVISIQLYDDYRWQRDFDVQIYETGIDVPFIGPKDMAYYMEKYT